MPQIVVLAGTNGAGKSSVGGEALKAAGMSFFNPDEYARRLRVLQPGVSIEDANSRAWHAGRMRLEQAIERRSTYAFETTLGGSTITGLLLKAANVGLPVRMWYVGLSSAELHIGRVAARVRSGGHDIPEQAIRARYDDSRRNLVRLLPHLSELKLFDNSEERDTRLAPPRLRLLLHVASGVILHRCAVKQTPAWAKPVIMRTLRLFPPWK